MSQIKEQEKTPEKELNDIEARNLPDTEFKTLVTRMLKELRGRIDKLSENFNKEIVRMKGHRHHKKEPIRNEEYND